MTRDKHPDKEIEEALQYLESKNWRVEKSKAKQREQCARLGADILPD